MLNSFPLGNKKYLGKKKRGELFKKSLVDGVEVIRNTPCQAKN